MKHLLSLMLLICVNANCQNAKKKIHVLFIGNSYTYVNNLPQLVYQLAASANDSLMYDSYTPGGYTLNNHFNDAACLAKIHAKPWDFVVIQAQSQEPAFSPAQVSAQTLPYALKLDSVVKNNYTCTKTVFYETWGRKNGDASNCVNYPPICTYQGMQNRLKESYKQFADLTSGIMAPVGEAFRKSIALNPNINLYQTDQSHPSIEGSYLAAAVFYEVLFQKSVLTNTFMSSISSPTATFLAQAAHDVLRDSLSVWNLGKNLPWADYTYTSTATSVYQFTSLSPSLTNVWYFGDGTSSTSTLATHNYSSTGTYSVSHVVSDGCRKDSVAKIIAVTYSTTTSLVETLENGLSEKYLYPNPAINYLYFNSSENELKTTAFIEVRDVAGKCVLKSNFVNPLNIQGLCEGVYILFLKNNSQQKTFRFVKVGD